VLEELDVCVCVCVCVGGTHQIPGQILHEIKDAGALGVVSILWRNPERSSAVEFRNRVS
jgi:hypothetical protein